jgi:hypothetical protein
MFMSMFDFLNHLIYKKYKWKENEYWQGAPEVAGVQPAVWKNKRKEHPVTLPKNSPKAPFYADFLYLKRLSHQFEFGYKYYGWIDHNQEKNR